MNAAVGETLTGPMTTTGDSIFALCASPNFGQDKTLFAARASGLWRSSDAGHTWTDALGTLARGAPLPVLTVAVAPDYPREAYIFAGASDGVLVSSDDGVHWQTVLLPQPPPLVSALVVSPNFARDSLVFAATLEEGVFRSTDGGRRWVSANFGLLDLSVYCLAASPAFESDETLFAGTSTGVFISRNGGRAWRETSFPADLSPVQALAVSPQFKTDGTVFAATEADGLFRSQDGGRSWLGLAVGKPNETINAVIAAPGDRGGLHVLAAGGDALWSSDDNGETWKRRPPALDFPAGIGVLCAPLGLHPGAPIFVCEGDGKLHHLEKPS